MITYNSELKIFQATQLTNDVFFSGFSSIAQGDAKNPLNIRKFFDQQNLQDKRTILLEQIHSTNIEVLDSNDKRDIIGDTDGVITNSPQSILIVRNADCVPVIYADKVTGYIGISHQGWRGTLKNLAEKMVKKFLSLKSSILNLYCAIGPSIGMCCYDIDEDEAYEFLGEYEEYKDKIFQRRKGRWHLSLNYLNYQQLLKAGVKKENIDIFPFCTKCDEKRLYSRRRAQTKNFPEMFNFILKKK